MRTPTIALFALLSIGCESNIPNYVLTPPTSPSPPSTTPPPTPPAATPAELRLTVTVGPTSPIAGTSAAFNAIVNPSPTAPVSYAWTFGDGASRTVSSESTFYTYGAAGSYNAAVTVADGQGRIVSGSAHVTVLSPPPPPAPDPPLPPPPAPSLIVTVTCTAGGHTTVPLGTPTACNVTASYGTTTLPGSAVTSVDWDWADGTLLDHQTVPIGSHQYTVPGTFTIFSTVTAMTVDGPKTVTVTTIVKVG